MQEKEMIKRIENALPDLPPDVLAAILDLIFYAESGIE